MTKRLYKNKYRVDTTRLRNWDYSRNGIYSITICTKNKIPYFGEIKNQQMNLNELGEIAEKCWMEITKHFPFVKLNEFVVMPNHIHGIIIIDKNVEAYVEAHVAAHVEAQDFAPLRANPQYNKFGPQSKNLASIVRGFKVGVTKWARENNIEFFWQKLYYDNIVRNEKAYENIKNYIRLNPQNWEKDRNNDIWI